MRDGQRFERIDETKEKSSLKASMKVNQQTRDVLIGEDGMFRSGLLPQIAGVSAAGSKQILDIVGQADLDTGTGAEDLVSNIHLPRFR